MHTAIIAQDAIIGQLRRQWCENRVPHALLLCGPSGCGKMAVALDFARLLLCEHPTSQDEKAQPCGTCPSCTLLRTLVHPDLHFVFPVIRPANVSSSTPVTSDLWIQKWREMLSRGAYFDLSEWEQYMNIENQQPAIYAEESDNLLQKVSLVPARGGYRVVIIWLPELMNTTCANKMLKLLEEPPHQTVFLLCSNHPGQMLPTLLSRTQQIRFKALNEEDIASALTSERGLSAEDAARVAHPAMGSYTRALQQLSTDRNREEYLDMFMLIMRKCYMGETREMLTWSERMAAWGRERQKGFIDYALGQIRENFISNFHLPQLNYLAPSEAQFSERFAPFIHESNILGLTNEFTLARRDISQNVNARMVFFDLALKIAVLIRTHLPKQT